MRILPAKRGGRDSPGYRVEGILKRRWCFGCLESEMPGAVD